MNNVINITSNAIGDAIAQTVNARELHGFLEVGRDFSTWIKDRIAQYGFSEGQDYVSNLFTSFGEKGQGRPTTEYHISLDMAKELAMVERNEKGKQARQYFIECERKLKNVNFGGFNVPQNMPQALRLAADLAEGKAKAEAQLAIAAPKAEALDRIAAGDENVTITQAAKVLGIKRELLTQWMHANGWVYRQNGSWVAYDAQIRTGRLAYKEAKYTDENTGQEVHRPYCHITPKGLTWLAENGPRSLAA